MNGMNREQKIRFIEAKIKEGWKNRLIISITEVPRRTYFYWKSVMNEQGIDALINKKKPGPKPSFFINTDTKQKILQWRRRYGWGPTRIEGHLEKHHNIHFPHNRIHRLLIQKGMNEPIQKPRKTWGKKRWERKHSMSLLQADWKDVNVEPGPMLTFIDDHSRFILGSRRFDNATVHNSIKLLERVCRRHGCPEQVLTDNGTQFANNQNEFPSTFTQFCIDNGIEHIRTSKKRPTTTGKIEAFHGCYEMEAWRFKTHSAYIRHWNYNRPHGAIGYLYPVEVFYKDRKRGAINSG